MGAKRILPIFYAFGAPGPTPTSAPTGLAVTGTNTYNSKSSFVYNLDNLGLQIQWTGTAVGTFSVLGSNDGITFDALTFNPTLTQPAGSAGGYLISLTQFPWQYLQVQYVNASGSGSIVAILSGKDLN